MSSYVRCIHGMIWMTCQSCREKTEEAVVAELNFQHEEQKRNLIYDYQEANQDDTIGDADLAYDIDDMGM